MSKDSNKGQKLPTPKESKPKEEFPGYIKFINAGLATVTGQAIVHPMDVLKNRMQVSGMGSTKKEFNSTFDVINTIIKNEGIMGMYRGLSASLLRQATYGTVRLGAFSWLSGIFTKADGTPPSMIQKAGIAMLAGGFGSFVGNPCDVALIRMSLDGRLPPSERRNYKNVFEAIIRITREEGILALWTGVLPTMSRAIVANIAQLTTYAQSRQMLLESKYFQENFTLFLASSMLAGLASGISSLPFDIVKTRLQNMKLVDGKPEFSGSVDVFVKIIKIEGIMALWKGFTPYYSRVGPHTVFTFLILEKLNELYKKFCI